MFTGERSDIVNTIIDSDKRGSGIYIHMNPYQNIINGFTITNSAPGILSANGSGVFIRDAAPIISNCIIEHNIGDEWAGGIMVYSGSLYLSGTTIRHNCAYNYVGGIFTGWGN